MPVSRMEKTGHFYSSISIRGDQKVHLGDTHGASFFGLGSSVPNLGRDRAKADSVLKWLSAPIGSENRRERVASPSPGTCRWVLKTKEFREWRNSSILWLHGPPGSGKTTLFTYILEHLASEAVESDTRVIYFYCDFRAGLESSYEALLRTLTHQLVQQVANLPRSILGYYDAQSARGQREAPVATVLDILNDLLATIQDCVLMVDALDEMSRDDDQQAVLELLAQLVHNSGSRVHVFITSRVKVSLLQSLGSLADFQIDLGQYQSCLSADIQVMIDGELEELGADGIRMHRSGLHQLIAERANGSMLWVRLTLSHLRRSIGEGATMYEIHDKILRHPPELEYLYESMLESIPVDRKLSLLVIQCVAYAPRPLLVSEIRAIIAIHHASLLPAEDFGLHVLIAISGGFITSTQRDDLSQTPQAVTLVHTSARDFLATRFSNERAADFLMTPHASHTALASYSVDHLLQYTSCIATQQSIGIGELTVLPYALEYWLYHLTAIQQLGEIEEPLSSDVASLLGHKVMRRALISLQNPDWAGSSITDQTTLQALTNASALYYASRLGLLTPCQILLAQGASPFEECGRYGTPVHAAAVAGHIHVLYSFIAATRILQPDGTTGTSIDPSDSSTAHPLPVNDESEQRGTSQPAQLAKSMLPCFACVSEVTDEVQKEIVQQILENDHESGRYGSCLQLAVYGGHIDIVRFLLDLGIQPDAGCMQAAAYQGHVDIFAHLSQYCSFDMHRIYDEKHRSPLHKAALNGQLNMIKQLLKLHFDPEDLDNSRSTPLDLTAERHHFNCFDWLLAQGQWHGRGKHYISRSIEAAISNRNEFDVTGYHEDRNFGMRRGRQATVKKYNADHQGDESKQPSIIEKHYDFRSVDWDDRTRALECLWREQSILRQMSHPNIVRFLGFNFDEDSDQADLYMEFSGEDMHRCVKPRDPIERLPPHRRPQELCVSELWSIVVDLASALAYCHHGIHRTHDSYVAKAPWETVLHRDIKPTNVLRMRDTSGLWTSKLCDLGLAKVMHEIKSNLSVGMGTEKYLAPELIEGGHPSIKSDIYAFGCTILSFYQSPTDAELFPQSTETLRHLMSQCTKQYPKERPSSLEILQAAIREKRALHTQNPQSRPLISQHSSLQDYVLQAFVEILNRLFRAYRVLPEKHRQIWCTSLCTLKDDTKEAQWRDWSMDSSLLLTMILKEWSRAPGLMTQSAAPACERWWDNRGITPLDVARTERQDDLVLLLHGDSTEALL